MCVEAVWPMGRWRMVEMGGQKVMWCGNPPAMTNPVYWCRARAHVRIDAAVGGRCHVAA